MRASRCAEAVDELESARDASAETNAVVGAGDVIVHRLRNGNDPETFFVKPHPVTERVVSTDGDEHVDAEPGEILQDFRCKVVFIRREFVFEVSGDIGFADSSWIRAGGMKERAAGATRTINDLFVKEEEIIGVVEILIANHVNEAGPAVPNADDVEAFAKRAERNTTDGGVETGNVAPPLRKAVTTFFVLTVAM